jgi:hypothetical protein
MMKGVQRRFFSGSHRCRVDGIAIADSARLEQERAAAAHGADTRNARAALIEEMGRKLPTSHVGLPRSPRLHGSLIRD